MVRKHGDLLEMVIKVPTLLLPSLTPDDLLPQLIEESQIMPFLCSSPFCLKVKSDHSLILTFSASL